MKVLIAAQIDVEPATRADALSSSKKWIDAALEQPGCLRYDWSADGSDPGRINVFEEWESQETLAKHFQGDAYAGMRAHIGTFGLIGAQSSKYLIQAEGEVYDEQGQATASFSEDG